MNRVRRSCATVVRLHYVYCELNLRKNPKLLCAHSLYIHKNLPLISLLSLVLYASSLNHIFTTIMVDISRNWCKWLSSGIAKLPLLFPLIVLENARKSLRCVICMETALELRMTVCCRTNMCYPSVPQVTPIAVGGPISALIVRGVFNYSWYCKVFDSREIREDFSATRSWWDLEELNFRGNVYHFSWILWNGVGTGKVYFIRPKNMLLVNAWLRIWKSAVGGWAMQLVTVVSLMWHISEISKRILSALVLICTNLYAPRDAHWPKPQNLRCFCGDLKRRCYLCPLVLLQRNALPRPILLQTNGMILLQS